MTTSLQPYPHYKPSGIDWLGDIPSHWATRKLKFAAEASREVIDAKRSGKPYVGLEQVQSGTGKILGSVQSDTVEGLALTADIGTVIFGKLRPYLSKVALVDRPIVTSTEFFALRSEQTEPGFLQRLLISAPYIDLVDSSTYGAKMPRANWEFVGNTRIPLPPLDEQRAIADFLDRKDAEITRFIASRRRMIALLEEKKQAIINQAVTRGLHPTVPMKDSGVEWLGEIPAHWEVRKVSQCFGLIGSGTTPPSGDRRYYDDGDTPWINTGDLRDSLIRPNKTVTPLAIKDFPALRRYPAGSLIVAMYGATIGKTGILTFEATVNQACLVLSNPKLISPALMQSMLISFRSSLIDLAVGGGQPNINSEIIRQFRIAIPPLDEQSAIAMQLDQVDQLIMLQKSRLLREIELMQEYRTRLISDVVTGKVKVA